jgi:Flp pilus assembly protein TadG
MLYRHTRARRRGASLVEFALVGPLTLLIILGLLVAGMGIFRYQQVASLAREGARWASVHGGQYAHEHATAAATSDSVRKEAILPRAVALDHGQLTCTVTWNGGNWPNHAVSDNGRAKSDTVSVTVTYRWLPEWRFGGITLTSTSVMPIHY